MDTNYSLAGAFIMISAERPEYTADENAVDTMIMGHYLRREGLTYHSAVGRYNGTLERSFKIDLPASPNDALVVLDVVQKLTADFRQESVLVVKPNGEAYLVYLDKRPPLLLGEWTEADAAGDSDYTIVGGKLFVVRTLVEEVH